MHYSTSLDIFTGTYRCHMQTPFIIGITGGSGSGKTTFIKRLRSAFSEEQLCIISQDEYYRPREQQRTDEIGIKNFDLPNSIDHDKFIYDLKKIASGQIVTKQEYTFNNEQKKAGTISYLPAPVIVVEGLFVFYNEELRNLMDLRVFIYAKENLKVIRRIKRDQLERNYPLEDVLYRYENHVLPSYEAFIKPFIHEADIVVNNNQNFERGLKVINGFILSRVMQLKNVEKS
jgi:uridine kinase